MTDNLTEKTVLTEEKPWQFKKGKSGNPKGRPKNPTNKATLIAKELFEENSKNITEKIIELALEGDLTALKICLDRLCPVLKSQSQLVELDINSNNKDLTDISKEVFEYISKGLLAPDIGSQIISSLSTIIKSEEIEKVKNRLEALEISLIKNKV